MTVRSTNGRWVTKIRLWQVLLGLCVVACLGCSVDDGDPEDGLGVDESTSSSSAAVSSTTAPVTDEPGDDLTSTSSVPVSSTTLPVDDDDVGGSVGETDAPSESGGAKALEPWVEDRGGGLLWFEEPDVWEKLSLEVFDWCDDNAATIAVFGRPLVPGEDPLVAFKDYFDRRGWPVEFRDYHFELEEERRDVGADCTKPGGKRYSALVSDNSPYFAFATEAEAIEYRNQQLNTEYARRFPSGWLLGWWGDLQRELPLEPRNEVVVLDSTVTVSGGVIRGLVHNLSRELFARNVTVTARPVQTDDNIEDGGDQELSWQWPLTLQPGEQAPFELKGWKHGNDLTKIDIRVTAALSPEVDITRSFIFVRAPFGDNPSKGGRIDKWYYEAILEVPTSHPSLADAVLTQTIPNLRAFVAFFDDRDGKVIHLEQLTTHALGIYDNYEKSVLVEIASFPATLDDFPEPIASRDDLVINSSPDGAPITAVTFLNRSNYHQVWVGGANPQPEP